MPHFSIWDGLNFDTPKVWRLAHLTEDVHLHIVKIQSNFAEVLSPSRKYYYLSRNGIDNRRWRYFWERAANFFFLISSKLPEINFSDSYTEGKEGRGIRKHFSSVSNQKQELIYEMTNEMQSNLSPKNGLFFISKCESIFGFIAVHWMYSNFSILYGD